MSTTLGFLHDQPLDLRPVDGMTFTWIDTFAQAAAEHDAALESCWWCEEYYGYAERDQPVVVAVSTDGVESDEDHWTSVMHPRCVAQFRGRRQREADAADALADLHAAFLIYEDPNCGGAIEVADAVDRHWDVIQIALATIR